MISGFLDAPGARIHGRSVHGVAARRITTIRPVDHPVGGSSSRSIGSGSLSKSTSILYDRPGVGPAEFLDSRERSAPGRHCRCPSGSNKSSRLHYRAPYRHTIFSRPVRYLVTPRRFDERFDFVPSRFDRITRMPSRSHQ